MSIDTRFGVYSIRNSSFTTHPHIKLPRPIHVTIFDESYGSVTRERRQLSVLHIKCLKC